MLIVYHCGGSLIGYYLFLLIIHVECNGWSLYRSVTLSIVLFNSPGFP